MGILAGLLILLIFYLGYKTGSYPIKRLRLRIEDLEKQNNIYLHQDNEKDEYYVKQIIDLQNKLPKSEE